MEHYSLYIKERNGEKLYSDEFGFFSWKIVGRFLEIGDLFVHPDYRREGEGMKFGRMIEQIARSNDCEAILCASCTDALNWQDSHNFILANEYKEIKKHNSMVYYRKDL